MTDWTKGIPADDDSTSATSSSDAQDGKLSEPTPLRPTGEGTDWTSVTTTDDDSAPHPSHGAHEAVDWTAAEPIPAARPSTTGSKDSPTDAELRAKSKRTFAVVAGIGAFLFVVVVIVANTFVGQSDTDESADEVVAEPAIEGTSEDSSVAPTTTDAEPIETEPPARTDDTASVGGECSRGGQDNLPVTPAGQNDLREAWVSYNENLYQHNDKGLESVLTHDSTMRGQDWEAVFDQIDSESAFCLQMDPIDGDTVTGELEVTNGAGDTTVFRQSVTGREFEGRWYIKDINQRTGN